MLHWPSWRHTSYCLLRKAHISSHVIQSTDNSRLCVQVWPIPPLIQNEIAWDSHRTTFSPSLCKNHHTKSATRPPATPSSCSARYGTCLNPCAHSFPQLPMTMQIHSAGARSQDPSSYARAAALEGEDTKQSKVSDSSGSTTIIHLGKKTSGKLFPRTCVSQCQVGCWQ